MKADDTAFVLFPQLLDFDSQIPTSLWSALMSNAIDSDGLATSGLYCGTVIFRIALFDMSAA